MDNEEKITEEQASAEAEKEKQEEAPAEETAETGDPEECAGEAEGGAPAEQEEAQEDLQLKYLRLAADFQNFKRRSEKERADVYAFANEKFAKDLLEVIDNFERAMAASSSSPDDKFAEGMELILKQLKGVLDKNHVTEIEAEGKAFDPNFHNAVLMEDSEEAESGTVTRVLQKGYLLNGRVIRPVMVAVAN